MPKARLKAIQRRLLHEILDRIPPHDAVHSYRRGRSIATYIAPHTGRALVLHMDLRDFFPSIRSSRVHALFCHAGYPPAVARALTGLCTNVVPWDIERDAPRQEGTTNGWGQRRLFRSPHLPQGAPTSPALANLCAYRLDCRLAGLAKAVGACYTRYADDLAFSGMGELERCARRFQVHVCRIALEEGLEVHTRKTRFMRQGVRQQIAGIVVNVHSNIRREEYERLKAILYNCVRHGPQSQNREGRNDFRAYLVGRVAYVRMLNPSRGRRLNGLLERINWENA
jgi:RNA-directed DNA polymerase